MYKPPQDLCLYSVIVFNVDNDSYSLSYCSIDCPSEIRMHFIDHLVPLDFWVPADVNSIYCLSTLSLCPRLLVCLNSWPLFPWGTSHSNIFSRTLRQKHWVALPKIPSCGMAELPELLSLHWAKFQYFGLLSSGAEVELYTKRNHISVCLSKCRDNQSLPSGSHLTLCFLSSGSEFRLFQDDALCHHCVC